jgi:hypothetical protein
VKRSKYGNKRTPSADGIAHHSAKEARRWDQLRMMERAGAISELGRQVRFKLIVAGMLITTYVCDFRYRMGNDLIVEDVKGHRTPVYVIKRKLMKACLDIEVLET